MQRTRTLYWDIETRSTCDLRKAGVYVYAQDPTTEVLLAAWSVDDGSVQWARIEDPACGELRDLLADPTVRVVAHNAGFERLLLTHVLAVRRGWPVPELARWDCTAARAARQSLPRSLDGAARALGLDVKKDLEGHALMMRMCKPRKARLGEDPSKTYWFEDEPRMQRLGEYCATDVEVERLLDRVLKPWSDDARAVWELTETINDRGVPVDVRFANDARWLSQEAEADINQEMRALTEGSVPSATNLLRLRDWLLNTFGLVVLETPDESLTKASIEQLLTRDIPPAARRALELRLLAGKASVKKFQALIDRSDGDCRVRGNLVYHGASTGRWAGAGVQMQNMPRKTVRDFDDVAADVRGLDAAAFAAKRGSALEVISHCLRGTLRAAPGSDTTLMWADYNAVEARGVAWLAGAQKLVGLFAGGGKVYEAMAATIFNRPASEIANPSPERFVAKTVVLGCGYGMGPPKFRATCAAQGQEIDEALAKRAVSAYRDDNPEIPALWRGLEQAAIAAVGRPDTVTFYRSIKFLCRGRWLMMRLPSGRCLWYRNPRVIKVQGPFSERPVLEYDAVNSLTKQWSLERTWGGKLAENAVQGLCADLIAHAMLALEAAGYPVILSVHDEVICEVPLADASKSIEEMQQIMCRLPSWAAGFPLASEGKEGRRYGK